jgi:predicted DsbA family dithiol-disulfide isomerase
MNIEVWTDVVCPWCYVGKRRLDQALDAFEGRADVTVVHRAFQLDPNAITRGQLMTDLIAEKYGTDRAGAAEMMRNVSDIAATVGLNYRLDETVSGNTRDAHRLLLWAQDHGKAQELLDSMYSGYFEQAKPVFVVDDLLPFAAAVDLDVDAARAMLSGDRYISEVTADQELASQFGANGVPFFVFDRTYGISGAQPLEAFVATLEKAAGSVPE